MLIANLLVLPLEHKLREHSRAEGMKMALITGGVLGLAAEDTGLLPFRPGPGLWRPHTAHASADSLDKPVRAWLRGLRALAPQTGSVGHDR